MLMVVLFTSWPEETPLCQQLEILWRWGYLDGYLNLFSTVLYGNISRMVCCRVMKFSSMEDDSFLDEFRAYMKHYLFHSLKHSKLKSITEPTHVIKCHSVSPKAPNLKNLTTFSHYIDRLASGDTIGIPKLMSKDVKDIVECLGISPHCEESIEARQKYMQSEDEEPLIFCIISTLVNSINRYSTLNSSPSSSSS
ncbi:uncharacterized protein LOC113472485 isoform X2 [Diaphorina citri]|uniref:Uncharacterized protein LOC113472485 isoform X2 n=1 Tax=Diaphorina citri TaxID=121845 RepID=A0A3Q0JLN0_DIACI|nr:uncharacterized protein LOC113472485 isoform X2 [Diaphorina citri]